MERFTVTCTTCQQRLTVRDESAIGELQICPKCGSMVLIQPPSDDQLIDDNEPPAVAEEIQPPGPQPPPAESDGRLDAAAKHASDSNAAHSNAAHSNAAHSNAADSNAADSNAAHSNAAHSNAAHSNAAHSNASESNASDSEVRGGDADDGAPPVVEPEEPESTPPVNAPPPPAYDDDHGAPAVAGGDQNEDAQDVLLPPGQENQDPSWNRPQWLWIAGAAIAGVALALGLLGFVASRAFQPSPSPPSTSLDDTKPADTKPADTAADVVDPSIAPDATPELPVAEVAPATTADAQLDDAAVEDATDDATAVIPETGDQVEPREVESSTVVPAKQTPSTAPEEIAAKDTPEPRKGDPSGPPSPAETPTDQTTDANQPSNSLAETLDAFAPFIDPDAFVPTPGGPPPIQENAPELENDGGDESVLDVPRPEPRDVDVDLRLADAVPSIEFEGVPLKAFIRFLMGFSTIPITLDPDAMALVGVTTDSPISVRQSNTTVERVLAEALTPLRLGVETRDDQIVVTRTSSPDAPLRTHSHPVDDLVAGDSERLDRLVGMIVDMVEPDSWNALGGEGTIRGEMPTLVIRHRDTNLFRAIVFCERLRAARGLPPQSNFDPALFDLTPRCAQAAQALQRPVTLNHIEPAPLVYVLDQLSDASGLQILIDWREIASLGWNPDGETTVSANAAPIGEVLRQILGPMGLTYRIINPSCVQVTSPQRLATHLEVEFFPVADLLPSGSGPDELLTRIRAELGEDIIDKVGATMVFDRPSGYLIAALPQPLQCNLLALLEGWRTTETPSPGPQG